jgi:hypothetical protein
MTGLLKYDELEWMGKEGIITSHQWPRFEPSASEIQVTCLTDEPYFSVYKVRTLIINTESST